MAAIHNKVRTCIFTAGFFEGSDAIRNGFHTRY